MTVACLVALPLMAIEGAFAAKKIGMANPASVHCVRIGGKSKILSDASGNQTGYCHLPNGRICEEWALFRDKKCIRPKG
ncbi:DUF333 domain-containing protein [Mesorhizobium loti]|nr:DUF333 domain-containing protein [Mesorhizobium loti]